MVLIYPHSKLDFPHLFSFLEVGYIKSSFLKSLNKNYERKKNDLVIMTNFKKLFRYNLGELLIQKET